MSDENKKKEDELLDHSYDGIEEYDNDLPKWWLWLFWLGIAYGFVYAFYYHVGPGLSQEETLVYDLEDLAKDKKRYDEKMALAKNNQPVSLSELVKNPKAIEQGKAVFVSKCASCHGMEGGGVIGPNLADSYWIHGGDLEQIKLVIENGVLSKGMLAWKGLIKDDEINEVVAYIRSIEGTSPANSKEPQGELYEH